jgi:polyisoprenoid-binding protein YceI
MGTELLEREYQGVKAPPVGTYTLDRTHTTLAFVAKHMMFTKVRGHFGEFEGTLTVGDSPETSSAEVTIKVDSITTGVEQRDGHLRSADFFEIETYPEMTFRSTKIEWVGGNALRVTGDLTIRGVTREVVLDAEYEGAVVDMQGGIRAAFSARTEIDREDWGITWNMALEAGGVVVSKKVTIEIDTETVLQQVESKGDLEQAS